MRFLVLAFAFASLMVNGQESKPHSDADKRNAGAESKDTTKTTRQTVIVVNQQTPQRQQNDRPANPPSYLHEYLLPANVLTLALVLVGVGGIIAAVVSLRKVDKQIGEMRRQVDLTFGQLRAMHETIAEMSKQTDVLEKSVAAAEKSAEAAKTSADIAARVSIPTLKIEQFKTGNVGAASNLAFFQFPKFEITVKNYGQTPAFLRSWTLKFTCEDLPDVPVYTGGNGEGIPLEKQVIAAGTPYTLPELPFYRRDRLSLEDAMQIIDMKKTFTVYGFIAYTDVFGNPIKRLKFCEVLLNINGGELSFDWTELFSDPPYVGTDLYPVKEEKGKEQTD